MLPPRLRTRVVRHRPDVIPAEVRLPDDGSWFTALVSNVGPHSVVVTAGRGLEAGTRLTIVLSDASAPILVDGTVVDGDSGLCILVDLVNVSSEARARLEVLEACAELAAVA